MIQFNIIMFLICSFVNYKIYRLGIEDKKGFRPVSHGLGLWLGWSVLTAYCITLIIKYLF